MVSRMLMKVRHSASFFRPNATNRTSLGVTVATYKEGVTSVWAIGGMSWAIEEGSPAETMIFLRGAMRFAVPCSATVEDR
jgi:hypothetical protein